MLKVNDVELLKKSALNVRRNIIKMIHSAKSGHPGGSLSGVEILVTLYKKSLNIIRTNIAFDFENEIENIFKLLDVDKLKQLKNT